MQKKNLLIFLLAVLLINGKIIAQNESVTTANYRLAERFSPEKIKRMVFSTSVAPNWLETGDKFWYSYKTSEGEFFYLVDLDKKSKTALFNIDKMAAMLTRITKDPYDGKHLPPIKPKFKKNDTVFQFDVTSSQDEEKIEEDSSVKQDSTQTDTGKKPKKEKPKKKVFHFEYNITSGELYEQEDWKEIKEHPSWAAISPDSSYVVFARDYNLYWMDKENFLKALEEEEDKKDSTIVEHQLTTDGEKNYAFGGGYTPKENDDEKTIKKESEKRKNAYILWSPDSKKFALERNDSRKVKALWVINVLNQPRPDLETYKYQMPGEKEAPQSELWVFDMDKKEGKQIDVSAFADQTINICRANLSNKDRIKDYVPRKWLSESSDKIYFTRTSRDLHEIDVCVADIETGEVKPLVEERLNTYVEIQDPHLINNGNEFIHWSERDGWAHFYLYDGEGNLKNQITSGPWHCERILKVDEKNRVMYFTANAHETDENPYYEHLYKVNLDGSGLTLLDKDNFNHDVEMSDSYRYFIDNFSRVNTTPASEIRDNQGKLVMQLETADLSNLFAAGYKFPEIFKAKAADGITDIYGVMYKPFDFDSTKLYPVLEYVYPGPQTEAVNASFSSRMDRTDRFAQLGFVIVTLGNRGGHPNRSKWYHNYGYNDLRDYGLADKKYVLEQLADQHKYIDIEKVGISGHSGGGFMSTAALLQYPDFYKVAVSSAGNHENNIYNRWWSEKHHGVKEEIDDKGESKFIYDIEKNSELAKNLKGKLLLVTGDMDNNVHPGNTFRMANALMKAKKRFDFFIMPGQRHGFGDYTEYFFWLKADYFCKHLIGDYSISTDIFEMRRETKMTPSKKRTE
ncbi:prolyl oligopeptidase family serine peptidase [Maribellus comscasis]|uniref:Prolyl oligopeptidase family serine peptidase n=1 Tax=Maribellus comscasis TaxID=2681766 RepID=A0A6I6JZD1_9BACT|nr:DPP IV N-terminal domain-containing protein [Maribellus comscasis]QGY44523.1 prolyl oligopeptidase family serine peptidase [Maribellus comscasis]